MQRLCDDHWQAVCAVVVCCGLGIIGAVVGAVVQVVRGGRA